MILTAEENFNRLDIFLSEALEISRSRANDLIKNENIKSDKKLKPSIKVIKGEKFFVEIPLSENLEILEGEDINFEVVYEDENILIINKPSGLVVHPAPGNWKHTLVNGLVYRYPEMKLMNDRLRPGIVHRLDAGTSGLMVVAKNDKTALILKEMFKERKVNKEYIALAHGTPKRNEGIISGSLDRDPDNKIRSVVIEGGKASLTGYKVLWSMKNFCLVKFKLFTGRTHQIRAHFSALGCPLLGDKVYGAKDNFERVFLHSWKLEFNHPITGDKMKFRQKVTEDFTDFIKTLTPLKRSPFPFQGRQGSCLP